MFLTWFHLHAQVLKSFGPDLSSCFLVFLPFLVLIRGNPDDLKSRLMSAVIYFMATSTVLYIFFFLCSIVTPHLDQLIFKPFKAAFSRYFSIDSLLAYLSMQWLRVMGLNPGNCTWLHWERLGCCVQAVTLCLEGFICSALEGSALVAQL